MEEALSTLHTKLTQLQFAGERTEEIIQSGKCDRIERQINALKELSSEADQLKRTLEGMKIADKQDVEEIKKWCMEIEERITRADDHISSLRKWLEAFKRESSQKL